MLPFTLTELSDAIMDGDVTARRHPTLPYTIYNYSPAVQYSNKWNDVTLNCRGLILDENYNIVARPWKKFFNLGQVNLPIQLTDPVEVMDKADGSLGILYPAGITYDSNGDERQDYAIATRGSFVSFQAQHATEILHRNYRQDFPVFDEVTGAYTFLFEIVYPENRIVLNYDGMDDLILLGAVDTLNGYYMGPREAQAILGWNGPVVKVFDYNSISEALGFMDRKNAEGYVIRSHNFMVKMKQPDYLDLHRLVTNMTPKTIWEKLKDGQSVSQICGDLPDEFHSMAEDFAKPLQEKYTARFDEILTSYSQAMSKIHARHGHNVTRKDYAQVFTKHKDSKYFFALLDDRNISELLWAELKPKETVSAQED